MDSEDEEPSLSSSTLDALKEFYADRDARLKQFEDLKTVAEDESKSGAGEGQGEGERKVKKFSMDVFAEDWGESQFWYSDETAMILAEQLLEGCTGDQAIAVVSAPSVFVQLKNILVASHAPASEKPKLWLLEYDKRFEVFPEFIYYDFKDPLKLPPELKGAADRIICDPPFLSEECQTKAAMTVRWLSKSWGTPSSPTSTSAADPKLIVCTGERMEKLITKLYRPQGIKTTSFEPVHSKGLSNEFFCYANFECGAWSWKVDEGEEGASSS